MGGKFRNRSDSLPGHVQSTVEDASAGPAVVPTFGTRRCGRQLVCRLDRPEGLWTPSSCTAGSGRAFDEMTRSGVWRASMTASSCDGSLSAVKYRSTSLTRGGPKLGGCIPKSAPSTPSSFTRSACDRAPALKSGRSDRRTECGEPGSDTVERTGNQNPRLFACAPSDLGRSALRPSPYPISLWLRLADNGRRSAGPEAARIDPRFELSVFASRLNLRCRGAAGLLVGNLDE